MKRKILDIGNHTVSFGLGMAHQDYHLKHWVSGEVTYWRRLLTLGLPILSQVDAPSGQVLGINLRE